jgi:uncharacterized protein YqeY
MWKETEILTTLIKQPRELVEAFTKGPRPELAEKKRLEIGIIEAYLPQASGEEDIRKLVHEATAHLQRDAGGVRPGPRDSGDCDAGGSTVDSGSWLEVVAGW